MIVVDILISNIKFQTSKFDLHVEIKTKFDLHAEIEINFELHAKIQMKFD